VSTETKWTPGTWRRAMDTGDQEAIFADNPAHPLICTVSKGSRRPYGEGNVALLLAAPDLYAALESAESALTYSGCPDNAGSVLAVVRAALSRARGETP
jgi:hypothetical protein